jgi:hypothetical protein
MTKPRATAASALHDAGQTISHGGVASDDPIIRRKPSWKGTLVRVLMICAGSVAILLPAWLPNRPSVPLERGTVEFLQAALLAGATAVMFGASAHAGYYRPVCRFLGFALSAALIGELEDFFSEILGRQFPEGILIGLVLLVAVITALKHKRVMKVFFSTVGHHAGSGFIAAALLIIYVFNRVIGTHQFWQATLGDAFSPEIPKICESYLELLACYLILVGTLGYAISLARRPEY